jgi:uncharacterized membrane protein (DUF485 family)
MRLSWSGLADLLGYIVMVGVASFLQKFSMKKLNPYQINFLMAVGMLLTAVISGHPVLRKPAAMPLIVAASA